MDIVDHIHREKVESFVKEFATFDFENRDVYQKKFTFLRKKYKINPKEKTLEIEIGNLMDCKSIKPRFTVDKDQIENYRRRYLPSRNMGVVIVSTNKGLMTHTEAQEEGIGGCLIAYFY